MKKSIIVFAIMSVLIAACSNDRETASGQKFTILKEGDGKSVDDNKILVLSYLIKDAKDSIWNDSRRDGFPWLVEKKAVMKEKGKIFEVLGMLTNGDSATLKMTANDFFVKSFHQTLPPKVDSASELSLWFTLKNALNNGEEVKKFQEELMAKQNEKIAKRLKDQLGKDTVIIDNYLKEKNISAIKTKSGLRYVITKSGSGSIAKLQQKVKVDYSGYVLNGKYFDSSIEAIATKEGLTVHEPYEFQLGRDPVILGWNEILQLMNKGEKITLYVPSTLGYGAQRKSNVIVENSILVFDMELIGIN